MPPEELEQYRTYRPPGQKPKAYYQRGNKQKTGPKRPRNGYRRERLERLRNQLERRELPVTWAESLLGRPKLKLTLQELVLLVEQQKKIKQQINQILRRTQTDDTPMPPMWELHAGRELRRLHPEGHSEELPVCHSAAWPDN